MRSLRRPNWRAIGIPPKQPDGPKLVKGQEAELSMEVLQSWSPCSFSESEMGRFPITVGQATDWFRAARSNTQTNW